MATLSHQPTLSLPEESTDVPPNKSLISMNGEETIPSGTSSHLAASDDQGPQPELCVEQFTIAWICALQEEYQAACQMLDDDDLDPMALSSTIGTDDNTYAFGSLGGHYVVVGCLPMGRVGVASAASVAVSMSRSFPNLKFALMVGIGGGAPNLAKKRDIRLGDVVVSVPQGQHPGVVQLDFGTRMSNGIFKRKGHLDAPPAALLAAIQEVQRLQGNPRKPDRIAEHMKRMDQMPDYERPPLDRLFRSKYLHQEDNSNGEANDDEGEEDYDYEDGCRNCANEELVKRKERKSFRKVICHYGTIASDNVVMRDAVARDKHSSDEELNILCFEMEAAGLQNNLRCLVIRGISDYSDSHKSYDWHKYAALTAAAYARELLLVLRPAKVATMPSWIGEINRRE